jgi:5-(carboxyamino)imidazole ribonucleotide synthase
MIAPGGTIGLLGGGQLGRMFALAARRMGYNVHTFEPSPGCPAGQISDKEINAPYTDEAALEAFAKEVDVITYEFENIPTAPLEALSKIKKVLPHWKVLHTCQNREREKLFLRANKFPCAPFAVVTTLAEFEAAVKELGRPCVLKTADFGYDGKGQFKVREGDDLGAIWQSFAAPRGVVEGWIDFQAEMSVICARARDGETIPFQVVENIHTNHVLDFSIVPARFDSDVRAKATALAMSIADALDVVGLLAVEMFLTKKGEVLVNELAPRPHNSGHYTFDACVTSQFEQQLRAVCGLPLGYPQILSPVVMVNVLGDAWKNGEPDWSKVLSNPRAKLHLYGKTEPKPGRKMGHFCVLAKTTDEAYAQAVELKKALLGE